MVPLESESTLRKEARVGHGGNSGDSLSIQKGWTVLKAHSTHCYSPMSYNKSGNPSKSILFN